MAGPRAQPRTPGVRYRGLRTVAFDGCNSVKIPDTGRNRSWIGKIRYRMGLAGYPTLRVMALAETGTRGLLGATVGSAGERDEAHLALQLLHLLGPGMLILLDRAFDANAFLAEVHATGAVLACRAKSARNPAVTEHLPDGSYLARLDDLPVRMIDAQVTMTGTDGSRAADALPVGAENLCHQAVLMNHASGTVTPLDPELIQVGDAIGQRAQRRGLEDGVERGGEVRAAARCPRAGNQSEDPGGLGVQELPSGRA